MDKLRCADEKELSATPQYNKRRNRLYMNEDEIDVESDTPSPPSSVVAEVRRVKLRTEISNIELKEDELLDISQTRRLVRKCVARNKLKST